MGSPYYYRGGHYYCLAATREALRTAGKPNSPYAIDAITHTGRETLRLGLRRPPRLYYFKAPAPRGLAPRRVGPRPHPDEQAQAPLRLGETTKETGEVKKTVCRQQGAASHPAGMATKEFDMLP